MSLTVKKTSVASAVSATSPLIQTKPDQQVKSEDKTKTIEQIMSADKGGKKLSNTSFSSVASAIISPLTLLTVPMAQRLNYWINVKMMGDYETYRHNHEYMAPLVLSPISSLGSWAYQPVLHFENVTEKEFRSDIQNTQVVIGNHVGYTDFIILMQIAIHYGVESHFVAYFMKALNKWPVLGPSLWAQIPLARDGSQKDMDKLKERLELYANSDADHLFALFPEGGLPYNPKLNLRTVQKNKDYGTDLRYMNFPKTSGFSQLIQRVGQKIKYVYTFVLLYNQVNPKILGNKVHVIIRRICKVSDLPKEPSPGYISSHALTLTDENRLFYAHEEFLLKWTQDTDHLLGKYYDTLPEEDRPTVENVLKKKFPDQEEDSDEE